MPRLIGAAVMILYPVLVWIGLSSGRPRLAALVLLAAVVPLALSRARSSGAAGARGLAFLPLVSVGLLIFGAALDDAGYVLAVPAAINLALLVVFGSTLRRGSTPMIERFARLTVADPTDAQRAWCRLWTRIWCAFFVVNGALAAALALWGDLATWATYNGLVAYLLMGILFALEWTLRRRRFGTT